jgi:activating signal cointegrator complex subunit 1
MALDGEAKVQEAVRALKTIDLAHPPFSISLASLRSMKPSDQDNTCLYAEVLDPSARLLPFCEQLKEHFVKSGLIMPENRPLKLHATIVNTIYAKERGRGRPPVIRPREVIDRYDGFTWARGLRLEKLAICKMGAKNVIDKGTGEVLDVEYEEIASVDLPTV